MAVIFRHWHLLLRIQGRLRLLLLLLRIPRGFEISFAQTARIVKGVREIKDGTVAVLCFVVGEFAGRFDGIGGRRFRKRSFFGGGGGVGASPVLALGTAVGGTGDLGLGKTSHSTGIVKSVIFGILHPRNVVRSDDPPVRRGRDREDLQVLDAQIQTESEADPTQKVEVAGPSGVVSASASASVFVTLPMAGGKSHQQRKAKQRHGRKDGSQSVPPPFVGAQHGLDVSKGAPPAGEFSNLNSRREGEEVMRRPEEEAEDAEDEREGGVVAGSLRRRVGGRSAQGAEHLVEAQAQEGEGGHGEQEEGHVDLLMGRIAVVEGDDSQHLLVGLSDEHVVQVQVQVEVPLGMGGGGILLVVAALAFGLDGGQKTQNVDVPDGAQLGEEQTRQSKRQIGRKEQIGIPHDRNRSQRRRRGQRVPRIPKNRRGYRPQQQLDRRALKFRREPRPKAEAETPPAAADVLPPSFRATIASRPGQPPSQRPVSKPRGEDARRHAAQTAHPQRQLFGGAASPAAGTAAEAPAGRRGGRGQRGGRGGGAGGEEEVEPAIGAGGEALVDGDLEGGDSYYDVVVAVGGGGGIQISIGGGAVDGGEGSGHGKGGGGPVSRVVIGLGVGIVVLVSTAIIVIVVIVVIVVVATLGPPGENGAGTRHHGQLPRGRPDLQHGSLERTLIDTLLVPK